MSPAALAATLGRSAVARALRIPHATLVAIAQVGLDHAAEEARAAAIAAARANGALTRSDELWRARAAAATYALPEGWMVQPADRGDGLVLAAIGSGGAPRCIGPSVYPVEELEDSTVRFAGWDRWGRPLADLAMPYDAIETTKQAQRALAAIGARMEDPAGWCKFVRDVLTANDLRIADPEPPVTEAEERERVIQAIRAAGVVRIDAIGDRAVIYVWVSAYQRAYGPVSRATRRAWARRGWIVRGADGRYTPQVRQGDRVGRVFAFGFQADEVANASKQVADAGLQSLDQRDREATAAANRPLRAAAAEVIVIDKPGAAASAAEN